MNRPIQLAVIGAGAMGANHVRVAKQLPAVRLAAVVDSDLQRAQQVAFDCGAIAIADIQELPVDIDAAIVAVPTAQHLPVSCALIQRGLHLLVEKPLAGNSSDALEITSLADRSGVILAVGHVERFNPVVTELPRFLTNPIHFAATRISPFTPRIGDGVIFDLMIHDIDIVCALIGDGADAISISGVSQTTKSNSEDLANITMRFSTGQTVAFITSRLGQQKIRTLEITERDCVVTADLLRQTIGIARMSSHEFVSNEGTPRYRQSIVLETPIIETRGEPLLLQLQNFVECIRSSGEPLVTGYAGLRAVLFAERAVHAIGRGMTAVGGFTS